MKKVRLKSVGDDCIEVAFQDVNIGEVFVFVGGGMPVPHNAPALEKKGLKSYKDGAVVYPIINAGAMVKVNKKRP